jgi:ABC-2 type transport system ATP-binding protein/lipopolysaccharide transport system ATP-binding protein
METAEREGRTVVFVSHNVDAVNRLCERALWLEAGRIRQIGATDAVVEQYLATQISRSAAHYADEHRDTPVILREVMVISRTGTPAAILRRDQPFTIQIRFAIRTPVPGLDFAASLHNMRGVEVLCEAWADTAPVREPRPGEYTARLQVPPVLNVGDYTLGVWFGTAYETLLHEMPVLRFRLDGDVKGRPKRVIDLGLPWQVEQSLQYDHSP